LARVSGCSELEGGVFDVKDRAGAISEEVEEEGYEGVVVKL
jgi:hypothetical protein